MGHEKNISEKIIKDLPYVDVETEGGKQTADLYLPEGEGLFPALILIHGGGYRVGSKEMYKEWGAYFASSGYVALSINYRLSTPEKASWPGVFEDVQASLNWLITHASEYSVDPMKIGVIGDSAGGHLAVLLALSDERVRVAVPVYGVFDLEKWWKYTQHARADDPVRYLFGGSPVDCPESYAAASPFVLLRKYIAMGRLPDQQAYFLIWGDRDTVVPPSESIVMGACLRVAGAKVETMEISGAGHFFFSSTPGIPVGESEDTPNAMIKPRLMSFLENNL